MNTLNPLKRFKKSYQVEAGDLMPYSDQMDLVTLLQYVIQVSGLHDQHIQETLGSEEGSFIPDQANWVITQYDIQLDTLPQAGDRLEIETQIIQANRFFVSRLFQVFKGSQELAEIYVQFSAIDLDSRSRVNIAVDKMASQDLLMDDKVFKFTRINIPDTAEKIFVQELQIEDRYIDVNRHVNNTVYLHWAYHTLPEDYLQVYQPQRIQVKYSHEILPEDPVVITVYKKSEDPSLIYFVLSNQDTGQEYCRIESQFIKVN